MSRVFTEVIAAVMILGILVPSAFGSGAKYEIFAQDGYVAVRSRENGSLRRTNTRTELLPKADQRLLEAGIPCENGQTVLRYLENFCS